MSSGACNLHIVGVRIVASYLFWQCPAFAVMCMLLTRWCAPAAIDSGDIDFSDNDVLGGPYCEDLQTYFDADLRPFVLPRACGADLDSIVELPPDFYDDFDGYDVDEEAAEAAAQALLPRPAAPPPPPQEDDCRITNATIDEVTCVNASSLEFAMPDLLAGISDKLYVVRYADAPGQGKFICANAGQYCNKDGLMPGHPDYPAERPYCNITAPFGVSYKATNGTIVNLLYQGEEYVEVGGEPDGEQCELGGVTRYGSTVNVRRRRCRRICGRCRWSCFRCRRCRRRVWG